VRVPEYVMVREPLELLVPPRAEIDSFEILTSAPEMEIAPPELFAPSELFVSLPPPFDDIEFVVE